MRCTLEEFEAVIPAIKRMSPERLDAIKQFMVYGATLLAVADAFVNPDGTVGVSRNAIHKGVRKVYALVLSYRVKNSLNGLIPSGWAKVELVMPRKLIAGLKAEIDKEWLELFRKSSKQ